MTPSYRRLAALAGAALVCAAPLPAAAAGKVYTLTISAMKFGPVPIGLRAGDAIEWVNADIFRHSATAKDKSFDVDLPPKAHARTVLKAGTVSFYCRYHPGMGGTLAVVK